MKPEINIEIDPDLNSILNSNYPTTELQTFIEKDNLKIKLVNYLLLYYNFNEIEIMKDNYDTITTDFTNQHYDITDVNYINKLNEYVDKKYLNIKYVKFLKVKESTGIFNEETFDDAGGVYFVIKGVFIKVNILNTFYYDNLLKLTSYSDNISNNYFTDFLTYHPMIIVLDKFNSILLNITDYESFDTNSFENVEGLIIDEIQSDYIFKNKFSSSTSKIISTTIPTNINLVEMLDEIYQDEILKMINEIEIKMDLVYHDNFKKILTINLVNTILKL